MRIIDHPRLEFPEKNRGNNIMITEVYREHDVKIF